MAVNTYYFDGSDAAASDPDGVWTDDANAFDGSISTFAYTAANGSTSVNFLLGQGTNAPSSGGTITQVRARMYNDSVGSTAGVVYTDSLGESLGTINHSSSASWSSYTTLSTPTGGWTWEKIQSLEVKLYHDGFGIDSLFYKVEIEVSSYTNDTGWVSPGAVVNDSATGTNAWTNPSNAISSNNSYAVAPAGTDRFSNYLKATNFGFSIPSGAIIDGIEARIERKSDLNNSTFEVDVYIVKADGSLGSEDKSIGDYFTTTDTYVYKGGSIDLWSETWSDTDVNDADFGIAYAIYNQSSVVAGYVDHIQIKVYYTVEEEPTTYTSPFPAFRA